MARVLIVDAEQSVCMTLVLMVRKEEHTVALASDAKVPPDESLPSCTVQ